MTVTLFIVLLIIPAIFFCLVSLLGDSQKIMSSQRLQLNWLSCHAWMQKEIKQGSQFRTEQEALLFELPTQETVRYRYEKGRVVREVKKPADQNFRGYTVLLQHVDGFRFVPYRQGVLVAFTLQDLRKASFSVQTYIGGRRELP